jgi:hypothetical protein
METPKEKTMGYFIITIIVSLVVFILIGTISSQLFGFGRGGWGMM